MANESLDPVLSEAETARLLKVSLRTLQRMCKSQLGPKKIRLSPGRVAYRQSDVIDWIASRPNVG